MKQLMEQAPHGAYLSGIGAAFFSVLRIFGDEKSNKWQRLFIEAPTAGSLGTLTMLAANEAGAGYYTSVFLACMIGHLGTDYIRYLARQFVLRR